MEMEPLELCGSDPAKSEAEHFSPGESTHTYTTHTLIYVYIHPPVTAWRGARAGALLPCCG